MTAGAQALFARECRFIASAPHPKALPPMAQPEIAFIGRSNVGKSSLINALTSRRQLARASETPGRTQALNFFLLDETLMLVDMPGYGYAKAPKAEVAAWGRLVRGYLRGRANLARVYVLIDARRGVMDSDHDMMRLLDDAAVSYQLILTKADKISRQELDPAREAALGALTGHPASYPEILVTSANTRLGLEEVRDAVAALLGEVIANPREEH